LKPTALSARFAQKALPAGIYALAVIVSASLSAQSVPYERTLPQSKPVVEKRLKEMQSSSSGPLPVLEGFTVRGDHPLDRFRRGYYQCAVQISSTPSGESRVRITATITAWYTDPVAAKSGYRVLPSNGRLEADFLDRLQEALAGQASSSSPAPIANSQPLPLKKPCDAPAPAVSAPPPGTSAPIGKSKTASSPFKLGDPLSPGNLPSLATQKAMADRQAEEQAKEAKGLEEILRNQAHPTNLVAVKNANNPVLASPSEGAKVLFLAAAEDEFEMLDQNPNWVHIRISGLSRGWIRRSGLEFLTVDPDIEPLETEQHKPTAADKESFHVENEQIATFPGNWEPLQGKTVRIVSVQKANNKERATTGSKLAFAKSLFKREYADLAKVPTTTIAGVVVIFDSEDGGIVAATVPALRQWTAGTLSDEAFWRRCFVDPPEVFTPVNEELD
jgi:hypothetical protein